MREEGAWTGSTYTGFRIEVLGEEPEARRQLLAQIETLLNPWDAVTASVAEAEAEGKFERVTFATVKINDEEQHMTDHEFNDYIVALRKEVADA